MVYITAFEFGPGPVTWLYQSEVANEKAATVATGVNWTFNLIIAVGSTPLINVINGYAQIIFGGCCLIAMQFCMACMKETKGLSERETKELYKPTKVVVE